MDNLPSKVSNKTSQHLTTLMDSKQSLKQESSVWFRNYNKFNNINWINESRYWIEINWKSSTNKEDIWNCREMIRTHSRLVIIDQQNVIKQTHDWKQMQFQFRFRYQPRLNKELLVQWNSRITHHMSQKWKRWTTHLWIKSTQERIQFQQ